MFKKFSLLNVLKNKKSIKFLYKKNENYFFLGSIEFLKRFLLKNNIFIKSLKRKLLKFLSKNYETFRL